MRKKLREEAGLTLMELMAATMILTLLVMILGSGLQMVLNTYETMIAHSETEILLSTAVDTLADDLRYAWEVGDSNDENVSFIYNSDSYGNETQLRLSDDGKLMAEVGEKKLRVLASGVYGSRLAYKEYQVTQLNIDYTRNDETHEIIFTIVMTVGTADGSISASTPDGGVTVRCLNPAKVTTP